MRLILGIACLISIYGFAQDSTRVLGEVVISAFEYQQPTLTVPAAVNTIATADLERFGNTSLLPALNVLPGVRMEERSPGSFRVSIRGSTIRSPFGIRNIKVYWNGYSLTDPGGNTYLNLLDVNTFGSVEAINGPGSSLYGAGTGGVMLLNSKTPSPFVETSLVGGSYGQLKYHVQAATSDVQLGYYHQQTDGYRTQSSMSRDVIEWHAIVPGHNKGTLSVHGFYSDLFYQTPGGLTAAQMEEDPSQARPPAGPNAGAEEQRAAVYNKTALIGISYDYAWSPEWSNKTSLFSSVSNFKNPAIRNYEQRLETSIGIRSFTTYETDKVTVVGGGEFQNGFQPIKVYENLGGYAGSLMIDDQLSLSNWFLFLQLESEVTDGLHVTLGTSFNGYQVSFERLSQPREEAKRKFDPILAPRIAVLKELGNISLYAVYSKGFSPPTIQELYPSTAIFDLDLEAEVGNNWEAGLKGKYSRGRWQLVGYHFRLSQSIVNRKDENIPGDPEYFVNAGAAVQNGIEGLYSWNAFRKEARQHQLEVTASITLNNHRFKDYVRGDVDYSGNKIAGTPSTAFSILLDYRLQSWYSNLTLGYTSDQPLDDANTSFADEYFLGSLRIGFRAKAFPIEVFTGIDNMFDENYSLGNDLNAVGGRYFNPAPPRNYYAGIVVRLNGKRE